MKNRFILLAMLTASIATAAEPLQELKGARLLENASNDGDSFWIQTATTSLIVRLYFADCPESSAFHEAMARRVREQMRYYGLHTAKEVMDFGTQAGGFTRRLLADPFTIHTAYTTGGGSSGHPRYYAFLTTSDGLDLASELVSHGFARAQGTGRPEPDGTTQAEAWDRLRDLEASAMLRRAGIWAATDAHSLAAKRATQRREEAELLLIELGNAPPAGEPVNINRATKEDLLLVPGVGPVTADRIIAGRPYTNVTDLARVQGLGEKTINRLAPNLTIQE